MLGAGGGGIVPKTPEGCSLGPPSQFPPSFFIPSSKILFSWAARLAPGWTLICLYPQFGVVHFPSNAKSMQVPDPPTLRPTNEHPSAPDATSAANDTWGYLERSRPTVGLHSAGISLLIVGFLLLEGFNGC